MYRGCRGHLVSMPSSFVIASGVPWLARPFVRAFAKVCVFEGGSDKGCTIEGKERDGTCEYLCRGRYNDKKDSTTSQLYSNKNLPAVRNQAHSYLPPLCCILSMRISILLPFGIAVPTRFRCSVTSLGSPLPLSNLACMRAACRLAAVCLGGQERSFSPPIYISSSNS